MYDDFSEILDLTASRLGRMHEALRESLYPHPDEGKPYGGATAEERKVKHLLLKAMEIIQDFGPQFCTGEGGPQYRASVLAALDTLDPRDTSHLDTPWGQEFRYRISNDPFVLDGMEEIRKYVEAIEQRHPAEGYSLKDRMALALAEMDPPFLGTKNKGGFVYALRKARNRNSNIGNIREI